MKNELVILIKKVKNNSFLALITSKSLIVNNNIIKTKKSIMPNNV